MSTRSLNRNLHAAKASKKDEFYTQLSDIEKELWHYTDHFKGKVVLCNCDDPRVSNFFHFFSHNFEKLGLKKLITTCYKNSQPDLFSKHESKKGIYLEYCGDKNQNRVPDPAEIGIHDLKGDGDFRSEECIELLKQADIVVTNPPFSLFREYVTHLADSGKKFLVIGNQGAISYPEIFSLIKHNKIWLGNSHPQKFVVPDDYELREIRSWRDEDGTNWRSLGNACWFTNMDIQKRHEELPLFVHYDAREFPEYDNYRAIEVTRFKTIPDDYDGIMGVPITFLEKYNPEQFEIVGSDYEVKLGLLPDLVKPDWEGKLDRGYVNGNRKFARLLIRKRQQAGK
ncbi:MAG: adenine-specific methyltransferase EcoRI family protein [Chloracidobacterium sp.]|nr:adenine-specific methyltransferase EcoRI family protein [Chloracidobacterium sp.]